MTLEQFYALWRYALKAQAESSKEVVVSMATAISSCFDKNVLRNFMGTVDRLVKRIDSAFNSGPKTEAQKQRDMEKSWNELGKLTAFLQGAPVGE